MLFYYFPCFIYMTLLLVLSTFVLSAGENSLLGSPLQLVVALCYHQHCYLLMNCDPKFHSYIILSFHHNHLLAVERFQMPMRHCLPFKHSNPHLISSSSSLSPSSLISRVERGEALCDEMVMTLGSASLFELIYFKMDPI